MFHVEIMKNEIKYIRLNKHINHDFLFHNAHFGTRSINNAHMFNFKRKTVFNCQINSIRY